MRLATILLLALGATACGSRTALDADAGQIEACDAAMSCIYSCDPGPPGADGACGNFSRDWAGACIESANTSHPVGCTVNIYSQCLGLCAAPCVCQTVPRSQEPDATMITSWGCPL